MPDEPFRSHPHNCLQSRRQQLPQFGLNTLPAALCMLTDWLQGMHSYWPQATSETYIRPLDDRSEQHHAVQQLASTLLEMSSSLLTSWLTSSCLRPSSSRWGPLQQVASAHMSKHSHITSLLIGIVCTTRAMTLHHHKVLEWPRAELKLPPHPKQRINPIELSIPDPSATGGTN